MVKLRVLTNLINFLFQTPEDREFPKYRCANLNKNELLCNHKKAKSFKAIRSIWKLKIGSTYVYFKIT